MVLELAATLLVGLIVLVVSSGAAMRHALGISDSLGLGRFAIGFIFISMTTTLPEISVAISSLSYDTPAIAVGNSLGSVLSNTTLIAGLAVLIGGTLVLKKDNLEGLVEVLFIASLTSIYLLQTGALAFIQGVILLGVFAYFLRKTQTAGVTDGGPRDRKAFTGHLARFLVWAALLVAGSELIVRSAIGISETFNLAPVFVGMTVVAIGTSLPELAVAVRSIKAEEYSLALGNLFGASIINMTLILGVLGVITKVPINLVHVTTVIPFVMAAVLTHWYLISQKRDITKPIALLLIGLFILFIAGEIGVATFIV